MTAPSSPLPALLGRTSTLLPLFPLPSPSPLPLVWTFGGMTGANSYFQWTRDSALVFKVLLNQYLAGNSSLEAFLREYAAEADRLQHTSNPSGGYASGGLGEPKFYVDGRAFTYVTSLHPSPLS